LTFRLIFENLRFRPLRTLLSILLIAIPVTLILTLVGISEGLLQESAKRTRGAGGDILVRPPNTSLLNFSAASMPQDLVPWLEKQPHVTVAVGTAIAQVSGLTSASGVDLQKFEQMSGGFDYIEGGALRERDDVLIDDYYAQQLKVHAGDHITMFNQKWRVAGIFTSGKLSHIVLPLAVVQDLLGSTGKVTQIYVKLDNPANTNLVMDALKGPLKEYKLYSMEDIRSQVSVQNVPGLSSFINVMIGIAIVIAFAVVCLSMYMAVLQRTREIGILKSLGASRAYVLQLIVAEAFAMGVCGTVLGIVLSFGGRWLIHAFVPASVTQAIVYDWWPRSGAIALLASLLGALYPGLHAARQDPIEALAYE
jgi:putative ABC transport system permease protein